MTGYLRQSVPAATVLQFTAELFWLCVASILAILVLERIPISDPSQAAPEIAYAILIVAFNIGFGVYRRRENLARSTYFTRVCVAFAVGTLLAYVVADVLPGGELFQQNIGVAALFAMSGLMLLRHAVILPLIDRLFPYYMLILGTGAEAKLVADSLTAVDAGVQVVGFYSLQNAEGVAVAARKILPTSEQLAHMARRLRVREIVVAVRQQRGGVLPLRELLACRLLGVKITDLPRFFERVHGHVPLEMSRASWFIYEDGYRQSWLTNTVKRALDLIVTVVLAVPALPIMAAVALLILAETGRPVIYRQERVGHRGKRFTLLKFRSMGRDAESDGKAAWAAPNDVRITRVGRFIRRTRIDELPQLINVLRSEMSIVGPRPERPEFVTMLSEKIPFYAIRHSVKPGITGWAQVRYSYVSSVDDTVKKLEYDIYYVKNHSLLLDLLILLETVRVVLLGEGAR